jgi:hypothetical protein
MTATDNFIIMWILSQDTLQYFAVINKNNVDTVQDKSGIQGESF